MCTISIGLVNDWSLLRHAKVDILSPAASSAEVDRTFTDCSADVCDAAACQLCKDHKGVQKKRLRNRLGIDRGSPMFFYRPTNHDFDIFRKLNSTHMIGMHRHIESRLSLLFFCTPISIIAVGSVAKKYACRPE
jgi:hypothetical protein